MQKKELKKESVKLLCCPFCGGEVKIIPEQVDARTVTYNFVCQNGDCCANVYFDYSDREESIEAWNTRKPMKAVVAELEVARKTAFHTYETFSHKIDLGRLYGLDRAIEIVRGKE